MKYNWQKADWPHFRYDLGAVEDQLFSFTQKAGRISGLVSGLSDAAREEALLDLMVAEAIKTSQIEGENLQRADVMSSIRNNLGLNTKPESVGDKRAQGAGELIVEVSKTFAEPLTEKVLLRWHKVLLGSFAKRIAVGRWRDHAEPMQIVSGAYGKEDVHFEAPPSSAVAAEMEKFFQWFNDTAPGGKEAIKYPPVRAAIAHLYFESIHPFEDGNGRIGRAISEKALSQGLGYPAMISFSKAVEAKKKLYYDALGTAQRSNEITKWIDYFVRTVIESQEDAEQLIEFILFKARLYDRFGDKMNARQIKAVNRMLKSGPGGFDGGMRTQKYIKITGASKATTARDLQDLVDIGIFRQAGDGRSTHYLLRDDF
jgi:Fic family protein